MSNKTNLCLCLFPITLSHSMSFLVSFHWFALVKFCRLVFFLSNIDLLILSSLLLAGFSQQTLGLFKKLALCSFKVIQQLFLPFAYVRFTTSLFATTFFPSTLTLLLILSGIFLYVDVIELLVNSLYSSRFVIFLTFYLHKGRVLYSFNVCF